MHKATLPIAYSFQGQGKSGLVIQTSSLLKDFSSVHVYYDFPEEHKGE